jgi:nitric oxide reductase subunit B
MLMATASVFTVGVGLFIWDFFRHAPRFEVLAGEAGDDLLTKSPAPPG